MKFQRFLIGLGWFTILYIVCNFTLGFVGGFISGLTNQGGTGAEVGRELYTKFGWLVLLASIIIAAVGTITEKLPGTKRSV